MPKHTTHCNTNHQNIVEYPVRLLGLILKKLHVQELFKEYISDPRTGHSRYKLESLLMLALSNHLFRSPSKNHFYLNLKRETGAAAVAKFCDLPSCPAVRTLDDLLLNLSEEELALLLPDIFQKLCRNKVFQLHPELIPNGEYAIAIDAEVSHVYHEHNQHPCAKCPYCLKRERGEKVWYEHMEVVASFIAPNGLQIPLFYHRVKARAEWGHLSDNEWKQECERSVFPVLIRKIRERFPRLRLCIHLDSLYATDPILTLLNELRLGYSIVRKAKVLKTVGEDCEGLKKLSSPITSTTENSRFMINRTVHFF
jgi:hypothetical protein